MEASVPKRVVEKLSPPPTLGCQAKQPLILSNRPAVGHSCVQRAFAETDPARALDTCREGLAYPEGTSSRSLKRSSLAPPPGSKRFTPTQSGRPQSASTGRAISRGRLSLIIAITNSSETAASPATCGSTNRGPSGSSRASGGALTVPRLGLQLLEPRSVLDATDVLGADAAAPAEHLHASF